MLIRMAAIALAACVGLCGPVTLGSGTTGVVALTGDAAAGTAEGVVFDSFIPPMLNNLGQVTLLSRLAGEGVDSSNDQGLWRVGPGGFELVGRSGSPAPGMEPGVLFATFGRPVLNDTGQMTLAAHLTGSGVGPDNDFAIWQGMPGSWNLLARTGSPAPGTPDGVVFSSFTSGVMNEAGHVAAVANLTGAGVDASNNRGLWRLGADTPALIARSGSPAPGTGTGVNFSWIQPNSMLNDAGQVAFRANVTGDGVSSSNDEAIWHGGPDSLSLVARKGSTAPGTASTFSLLSTPRLNNEGEVVFRALLTGGGIGIWAGKAEAVGLVARNGDPAPGAAPDDVFTGFWDPMLNDAGQVLFRAATSPNQINQGIWRAGSSGLTPIAVLGSQAPGAPSGVVFANFGNWTPVQNNAGQVAFPVYLAGDGVSSSNYLGLWVSDGQDSLMVARTGDPLEGRIVSGLNIVSGLDSSGGSDGRPRALNDLGQLAYHATFTDGGSGIFVFTPDLHWRTNLSGSWDNAGNWTLSLPPAHVHRVFIDPDAALTVTGPASEQVVRALAIGGGAAAARLELQPAVRLNVLGDLSIAGNGTVVSPGIVEAQRIQIDADGRLELSGQLLVRAQATEEVRDLIRSGTTEGWGILGPSGNPAIVLGFKPADDGLLVKPTFAGDGTLDGAVTIADLGVLAANWQQSDRFWFHGDFNHDGTVNIADLGILAGNWQAGTGGPSTLTFAEALSMFDVFEGVAIPEPGTLGILALLGITRRPRRHRHP
jgi:hypothetical protein